MDDIVANCNHVQFFIEYALDNQIGSQPLPFPGMDKSSAAVCSFYKRGECLKGAACPYRHLRGDRAVVCKHWLRGLCKKGDDCEFLHEYDMSKMPECFFFSKFGSCSNKECPFLHLDPDAKIKDCPWYDRGFCKHGPMCKKRHVRRVMCQNYLNGFCLDGPNCKYQHPSFDTPKLEDLPGGKGRLTCNHCGEPGHRMSQCFKLPLSVRHELQQQQHQHHRHRDGMKGFGMYMRNFEDITCFKCGEKGHFANKCTKNHLSFLSGKA